MFVTADVLLMRYVFLVYPICNTENNLHNFAIKTSDKKYERRFDRSTVIFKFKFMDKTILHMAISETME